MAPLSLICLLQGVETGMFRRIYHQSPSSWVSAGKRYSEHKKDVSMSSGSQHSGGLEQGPTSSGKTSLVAHLAAKTGHRCVRINNHEQTDLQEYLGSYVADSRGRLVFREGALVTALRKGHWVVLDELNLAPTEVLEALNR